MTKGQIKKVEKALVNYIVRVSEFETAQTDVCGIKEKST